MGDVMKPAPMDLAFEYKEPCKLSGEVTMSVSKENSNILYLKKVSVELESGDPYICNQVIIYYRDNKEYLIGNKVTVYGTIQKFSKATNPGQFNEYLYNKTQNIDYKVMAEHIEIIDSEYKPFHVFLSRIKQRLVRIYYILLEDKESGVIRAILLGERHWMDDEIKQLYQESGISHLLSISGLHVSLIGMTIYCLLKRMKLGLFISTLSVLLLSIVMDY